MKRGKRIAELVLRKDVPQEKSMSSHGDDSVCIINDSLERPSKIRHVEEMRGDLSTQEFFGVLDNQQPTRSGSQITKTTLTRTTVSSNSSLSSTVERLDIATSSEKNRQVNQDISTNSRGDDSVSVFDDSLERLSIIQHTKELFPVPSNLITPQDLGIIDDQRPSTSGLQYNNEEDFDSDDSVRDANWLPPTKTIRVSESDEENTDTDGNTDENPGTASATIPNSLRNILYAKKSKPRKALKLRRNELCSNKHLRNTGQAYFSKGKERPGRQMKELGICRSNCRGKITTDARKDLFRSYWQLGSYEKRTDYISSLIVVEEKKVQKVNATKHRSCSYSYYIHWGKELHEKVCKRCFVTIFGETNKFVTIQANRKKRTFTGIIPVSTRGLKSHPKWNESDLEIVRQHISSFPQYESHYGRSKTDKKFLPSHLNLDLMYSLYSKERPEEECVCKTLYTKIFESLNLSFKPPKVDTCTKCDKLHAQIRHAKSAETKAALTEQLNKHQADAENAYAEKSKDKIVSLDDDSLLVLTFDLQQCLPTPLLSSGNAFYKRSLWTFNLTIHNCKTKQATCYMWHEANGKRGGNNIASCLYDYIINLPPTITAIILYSDTCGGQNKNSYVSTMFLTLMKKCPHIKFIDHKFLVPGHTHMECDYDHSVIERAKKKFKDIHHPRDYYQMVRTAGKKGQFTVKEMGLANFYNFEKLLKGPLVLRKVNTNKEKFYWPDIRWFRYSQNDFIVNYKTELDTEDDFKQISFLRSAKNKHNNIQLEIISATPLPISAEKKRDLMALLPFIDQVFHSFYRNLLSDENLRPTDDPYLDYEFEGEEE